jgi:hypothetical protein
VAVFYNTDKQQADMILCEAYLSAEADRRARVCYSFSPGPIMAMSILLEQANLNFSLRKSDAHCLTLNGARFDIQIAPQQILAS